MKKILTGVVAAVILVLASCASAPATADAGAAAAAGESAALKTLDAATQTNVLEAFVQAEKDIKNREFKIGSAKGEIYAKGTVLLRDYSSGALIVMRSAADWYAFALVGPVLQLFKDQGVEKTGAPVSDEFPIDGGTQQVFEKGFVTVKAGIASWSEVAFKEPPEAPANIGKLTPGDEVIALFTEPQKAATTRAFREAYRLARIRGFNPGNPTDLVHQWDGPVTQVCVKGDSYSVSNSWGLMNVTLFFQPADGRNVYIVKDVFADTYSIGRGQGANSGPFGYGSAISDEYVKDGFTCQNYEKTLLQANPDGTIDIIYK